MQFETFLSVMADVLAPLILVGAATGIVGKYVYDYYVRYIKAEDKSTVRWDWKGFGLTFLVSALMSLVLYGTILQRVEGLNDNVLVLSISMQNGFFWQSIIGEVGKRIAEPQ